MGPWEQFNKWLNWFNNGGSMDSGETPGKSKEVLLTKGQHDRQLNKQRRADHKAIRKTLNKLDNRHLKTPQSAGLKHDPSMKVMENNGKLYVFRDEIRAKGRKITDIKQITTRRPFEYKDVSVKQSDALRKAVDRADPMWTWNPAKSIHAAKRIEVKLEAQEQKKTRAQSSKQKEVQNPTKTQKQVSEKRQSIKGELLEHGEAPYQHKDGNELSYFVTTKGDDGQPRTTWSADLERAVFEANVQPGDYIELTHEGKKPVTQQRPIFDETGMKVGSESISTHRNSWKVEKGHVPEEGQKQTPKKDNVEKLQVKTQQRPPRPRMG